jgi:sugar lactone lactonase YvrE
MITNGYGSTTSSAAALIVNELVTQPIDQTVLAGDAAILSVGVVGGGPLQFQWQLNGTNLPSVIRTLAGGSTNGFSGDGGPATNALLDWPGRIEFDRRDDLFIADCSNGRIRRVDTNGIITTVAGNGTNTDSGDYGPATDAGLYLPNDVAWDAAGNLYIGDYQHVRQVDTNGIITTASAAVHNASGMAMDGSGRLYIAQFFENIVSRRDPNGRLTTVAGGGISGLGDGGLATKASLNGPSDMLLDTAGNLYIADSFNNRVRKVDVYGIITTVAGNGQQGVYSGDGGPATAASLWHAQAMAMDAQGNLFIADSDNNRVREVDTNGIITTVAGNGSPEDTGDGGMATDAGAHHPWGIALDSAGNLFFSTDTRIREVGLAGGPTYTLQNVSLSNGGTYRVIINSPGGSVTSQVATLTVQARPSITHLALQSDGTVALSLAGAPNSTNRVWVTSDLTPPAAWVPISTNVAAADGSWQCTDSNAAGCTTRFYRISMP